MASNQRPSYPQRSYRSARETSPLQQARYRSPYAETVSDTPTETHTTPTRRAPRSATTDRHRTQVPPESPRYLNRDYPRAPPPASHRSDIGADSYMDFDMNDDISTHSSISQRSPRRPQRSTAVALPPPQRHFQRDNAPEDYYRPYQAHRRLLPTPVRPARTFAYELEPVTRDYNTDQASNGTFQPPQLQARPNTYQEITPSSYGMVLSRPADWDDRPRPQSGEPNPYQPNGSREALARPFLYDQSRRYSPPARSDASNVSNPGEPSMRPPQENNDSNPSGEDRAYYRMSNSAPPSHSATDVRQYRDRRDGQVIELRTSGGTTIRIVEDRGSE